MLQKLGAVGIAGLVALLAGIAVIAYVDWRIAAGLALVVAGLGMIVKALVSHALGAFGMGGGGGML